MNGLPKSCQEVQQSGGQDGNHTLDPEEDSLDPISVFCNMSSTPVTAVLHHNLENWTHVHGYNARGSYNAQVGAVSILEYDKHVNGLATSSYENQVMSKEQGQWVNELRWMMSAER